MKIAAIRGLAALSLATLTLTACGSGDDGASTTVADDCEPAHDVSTVEDGVLTVALTNTPPYSFEEGGKLAGIDSQIVSQLAEEECLAVKFAPYTYATAVPAVETGRVDVALGGFYRTAERAEVVTLSAPAYLDELTVMSEEGLSTVDDLAGKRIGTVEGYLWVDDLQALDGVETRVYPDSLSLANELKAGRIDAGLDGYGAALVSTEGTDYQLEVLAEDERVASTNEPSQTAILVDPSNDGLASTLDELLTTLRENGELVSILEENGLPASAAEVGEPRVI